MKYSVTCYFAPGATKLATVSRLGKAITACIGSNENDDGPDLGERSDVGSIDFDRQAFQISVLAADSYPEVHVVLTGK
jgi:hypothetical protein